ncbi:unnamed protein product [Paramecium primaurelia]|nr:unnamed protein product [Paramecium primaurelia]
MNGRGIYYWPDGRNYDGEYLNDKKHGFGVYKWNDGRCYEGYWLQGKQHGIGRYMLNDGQSQVGVWENGIRKKWLEGESKIERPKDWDKYVHPKLEDFQ